MSEWQPIETAPKDGGDILVFFPEDEGVLRVSYGYYGWKINPDGGTEFDYEITGNPTHWMPLPNPPVSP